MKKTSVLIVTAILYLVGFAHAGEKAERETTYPLTTCIVSKEGLGEMGKPFVFEYEGEKIQLCCKDCKKKFDKDPASYMKKLEAARTEKGVSRESESGQSGHQH